MLVPFVIDANGLAPDKEWNLSDLANHHRSLLKVWRQFGLLHCDGASFEASKLREAVDALPQKVRGLWSEMLQVLPIASCGAEWNGVFDGLTPRKLCHLVELGLVDDAVAEVEFEIAEEDLSRSRSNADDIEICRIKAAEHAEAFAKADLLAGKRISGGETYDVIWETRFRGLAKAPIKNISIVDRYAIEQHIRCEQDAEARRLGRRSGLARFLEELDKDATGDRHLTVYASNTQAVRDMGVGADGIARELEMLIRGLPGKKIKRLKLYIAQDGVFGRVAHGRYVRFDRYLWDMDLGLKVLEGPFASAASAMSFKSGVALDDYRNDESRLQADRQTVIREIRN